MWANGCLNNGIIYAWHDDRKMIETAMGSEEDSYPGKRKRIYFIRTSVNPKSHTCFC